MAVLPKAQNRACLRRLLAYDAGVGRSDALVHQTALLKNMTEISLEEKKLVVEMKGWDKLWALKSRLEIPLEHIKAVRADAEIAKAPKGIRMPGTHVPGVITAGTLRHEGDRVCWNVHHPENVIVIELHDERYAQLVVEVADPSATVATINNALSDKAA